MAISPRHRWTIRMKGAALLHIDTYEEVEADHTATGQAAGVVALVAIAQAIGGAGEGGFGIFAGVISALLGWLLWAGITYLIGAKLFGGTATWGELLRTIGFAQTPGVLYVLGLIPGPGWDHPLRGGDLGAHCRDHRHPASPGYQYRESDPHSRIGLVGHHSAAGHSGGRGSGIASACRRRRGVR